MDLVAGYTSDTSSDPDSEPELPPPDFAAYLENYLYNNSMTSVFLYMPWNPPMLVARQLKTAANRVLLHLRQNDPEYILCYTWNVIGEQTKLIHGKFSISNKALLRTHHVSLGQNIHGLASQVETFVDGLEAAIRDMRIHPKLIQPEQTEVARKQNINAILFGNKQPPTTRPKMHLSFRLLPQLQIFRSSSSNSIFLAAALDMLSPEASAWYSEMWDNITTGAERNNLQVGYRSQTKGPIKPTLHVSLLYGEMSTPAPRGFARANAAVKQFRDDLLRDIQVCLDQVDITRLGKQRNSKSVPFTLE